MIQRFGKLHGGVMAELILTDVQENVFHQLQERAARHSRTPAEEAKAILEKALHTEGPSDWGQVDAIYKRLSASGRAFSDSAGLLREDRER